MSRSSNFLVVVSALMSLLLSSGACIGVSQKRGGESGAAAQALIKVCRTNPRPAADGALDNLEDGNKQLTEVAGRDGYWWTASDPNGSSIEMAPDDGGADGSKLAMHASGETVGGAGAWGSQMGVNFVTKGIFYDATKYAGVSFKAKIAGKSTRTVRFQIGDINTHKDAGICVDCWNHFGKDLSLTPEWKEYRILFAGTEQEPYWGNPRPAAIRPDKLVSIGWKIGPGQPFDLWVDDLQLIDCD